MIVLSKRDTIISASLLSADFANLGRDCTRAAESGCDWLHFDVMDGMFVPSISFGEPVLKCTAAVASLPLDVHMMVTEPARYIERYAALGAAGITVHSEACEDVAAALRLIRSLGRRVGLSIKPATPVKALLHWLDETDIVLIMTVEPGFGGQKLMPSQIEKISLLRREGYQGVIAVDGGVTLENAPLLKDAGANWLIMGTSYFHAENPALVARKIGEMQ